MKVKLLCMLFLPMTAWAQKQYFLPTSGALDDEKDRPMIEVYLPKEANGSASDQRSSCAVVLCPGGAMRWLSWESDVVKMASFLNELPLHQFRSFADACHRSAGCTSLAHHDPCRPSQCGSRTSGSVYGVEEGWS